MITEKEAVLLRHLRQNSRKSIARISDETNIPLTTLHDTLHKLEAKLRLRHVSLLNFSRLGYNVRVNITIGAYDKELLKIFLIQSHNVNTLSSLVKNSEGTDFYADCVFRDLKEYSEFKDKLKEFDLRSFNETYVVDEIKIEEMTI